MEKCVKQTSENTSLLLIKDHHLLRGSRIIMLKKLSSKWPLGKLPPGQLPLGWLPHRQSPPRKIAPRINASLTIASWMIVPAFLLPDNYSKDNCSLTLSPWKLPPRKIAFGWFVAYIIAPRTNAHEENAPQGNCPEDKLHPRYFFPKN